MSTKRNLGESSGPAGPAPNKIAKLTETDDKDDEEAQNGKSSSSSSDGSSSSSSSSSSGSSSSDSDSEDGEKCDDVIDDDAASIPKAPQGGETQDSLPPLPPSLPPTLPPLPDGDDVSLSRGLGLDPEHSGMDLLNAHGDSGGRDPVNSLEEDDLDNLDQSSFMDKDEESRVESFETSPWDGGGSNEPSKLPGEEEEEECSNNSSFLENGVKYNDDIFTASSSLLNSPVDNNEDAALDGGGGGEEDEDEDEEDSDGEDVGEDSFDEEELHAMLDKGVKVSTGKEEEIVPREVKVKIVLEEKGKSNFEVLPEGWIKVIHRSGMPVYLHRTSRVVTVTKPYSLGSGSIRRHSVPIEAIPCFNYRKALDEEAAIKERHKQTQQQQAAVAAAAAMEEGGGDNDGTTSAMTSCPILPKAKLEVVGEASQETASVSPEEVTKYCKKLFRFREIHIRKFRNWGDRRKFEKDAYKKHVKKIFTASQQQQQQGEGAAANGNGAVQKSSERPSLPIGTKLITIPVVELEAMDDTHQDDPMFQRIIKKSKKEWLLNPNGKSTVCILHEYIQHSLKKQPTYVFEEVESSATPYSAKVIINGLEYGKGFGSSKKIAKNEAAGKTLEILIPEMKEKFNTDKPENANGMPDLSFFDTIMINDLRVSELCNKTSEPSPYAILVTCLQRNYGLGDTSIHTELKTMRHKKNEFIMRVNQKEVSVICKNKRDGKQLAAQKLLQQLHPHMTSWGSLLRLYGSRSIMSQRAKRERESEVTGLQSRNSSRPAPSLAILEKLKEEMRNLSDRKRSVAPIGKFVAQIDASTPATNNTCLEKVDL